MRYFMKVNRLGFTKMRIVLLSIILGSSIATAAEPTELNIELALKQQQGTYHPPYVASWIENSQGKSVRTLLLWREQAKWLKDIRRWWRKIGRRDAQLVDAMTSATRAAGKYPLTFNALDDNKNPLSTGEYTLFIEVVREDGGRAIIRQAFNLGSKKETFTLAATNETDEIIFSVTPQ